MAVEPVPKPNKSFMTYKMQETLLKLGILSLAAVLCKFVTGVY